MERTVRVINLSHLMYDQAKIYLSLAKLYENILWKRFYVYARRSISARTLIDHTVFLI